MNRKIYFSFELLWSVLLGLCGNMSMFYNFEFCNFCRSLLHKDLFFHISLSNIHKFFLEKLFLIYLLFLFWSCCFSENIRLWSHVRNTCKFSCCRRHLLWFRSTGIQRLVFNWYFETFEVETFYERRMFNLIEDPTMQKSPPWNLCHVSVVHRMGYQACWSFWE